MLKTAKVRIAGQDGTGCRLQYLFRGVRTTAARVFFTRDVAATGGRLCYVLTIESNADGSAKRVFAQGTRLNGFFVVDWDRREAVDFISPPPVPVSQQTFDSIQDGTGHGLLVLPDQSALWYASRLDSRVYAWSLPDLEFLGGIDADRPVVAAAKHSRQA